MADATISVVTALISGGTAAGTSGTIINIPTSDSWLIYGPSAGELDFNSLHIRMTASDATVIGAIVANSEFTGGEAGNYSFSIASANTVYLGGKGFEGSRFKQTGSSGTAFVEILIGSAASANFYGDVVQSPYSVSG